MKLFIVMYVLGKVAGSWGPLPYGLEECLSRASNMNAEVRGKWPNASQEAKDGMLKLGVTDPSQIKIKCEPRLERPKITFETPL